MNEYVPNEELFKIVAGILVELATAPWKYVRIDAPVLGENLGATVTVQGMADGTEEDIPVGWKIFDLQNAILKLRENIATTSGERIWGFKFHFYPNGKFDVEFSYDKPAEYDENNDSIGGEEINTSLNELFGKKYP